MAQIARLKSAEITNGNTIQDTDLEAEFDQLVNESNSQDTRLTSIESGSMSITGVKTFGSIPILPASDPTTTNQAVRKAYVDAGFKGQLTGLELSYTAAGQVTVNTGQCRDSTNTYTLTVASPLVIDFANSDGALGLDTGAEASLTWYWVYLIGKTDGTVSALCSVTDEAVSGSITLPSGYTLKREIGVFRNDGSANVLPFLQAGSWIYYRDIDYASGPYQVTSNATSSSFIAVDASNIQSIIPPCSRLAILGIYVTGSSATSTTYILRETGRSNTGGQPVGQGATGLAGGYNNGILRTLNTSQSFDWKGNNTNNGINIHVEGFQITRRF